ncbi:MAG TPA: hypothetical protein VFU59_11420 [Candidatus Eisenbacteria bacterium]|nr:hypothetical protein [Candidatus Eisenbacteria bacterium]
MRLARASVFLIALALLVPYAGYLTDDSFIHFQFAKHLLRGEGFAFNAGDPTYGATSPLWVLLLAATGAAVPGAAATPDAPNVMPALAWIAKAWGALFTLLAVAGMARLARRLGWDERAGLALAALTAFHAWSARWAVSGMETPLAFFLLVLALDALAGALVEGRGAWRAGAAVALAALARPEALLFGVLGVAALAFAPRPDGGPRARRVAAYGAGFAVLYGAWLVAAWTLFHRLLPNTSGAKAGAWFDIERGIGTLRDAIRIVLAAELLPVALAVTALALGAGAALGRSAPGRRAFWLVAALWPAALVLSFALTGVQVVSRYLIVASPCVLLLGVAALRHLIAARVVPARAVGAAWLLLIGLHAAESLYITFRVSAPAAREHTRGLLESLGGIGVWARENTPRGTLVAAADIGAFGYYSDRPVLDLYGLVTPAMGPLSVREGYDRIVFDLRYEGVGRPAYLVDRARTEARLTAAREPDNPYRFLFARRVANLGITRPGEWVYSVYAIDWASWDRLHPKFAER